MIRILLVDDHAVVRAGYRRFLEHSGGIEVVAEANDVASGYAAFVEHAPDVSIIDISLGVSAASGFDLIRRIMARQDNARVLAFSMHDDVLYASRAQQSGALGYVTKASDPQDLVQAVRDVFVGRSVFTHNIAQSESDNGLAHLSAKEFEVFRLLAQGHSAAEIANHLNLSLKTVANYQTSIKDKLRVNTSTALVHIALKHGVI